MALLDHLCITVLDLERGRAQFHPVLDTLGYRSGYGDDHSCSWNKGDETELVLMAPREAVPQPHRHGRVGWQHLAFAMSSRGRRAPARRGAWRGWTPVQPPKEYPRFSGRDDASFVEDGSGIRIECMHTPPRDG